MFKFVYTDKRELAAALLKTKQDYNLKNDYIAASIGVSSMTISNWLNFKTLIGPQHHEAVEDFMAKTWQPGIICIWNENCARKGQFLLVGSIYDPFYTWINNGIVHSNEEYSNYLDKLEREVESGEAVPYIVKKYLDLEEANTLGRDEEQQYNIGAMSGPDAIVHFVRPDGQIIAKPALVYEPNT